MFVGDESGVEAANGGVNDGGSFAKGELFLGRRRNERGSRVVELLNLFDDTSHFFFNLHGVESEDEIGPLREGNWRKLDEGFVETRGRRRRKS